MSTESTGEGAGARGKGETPLAPLTAATGDEDEELSGDGRGDINPHGCQPSAAGTGGDAGARLEKSEAMPPPTSPTADSSRLPRLLGSGDDSPTLAASPPCASNTSPSHIASRFPELPSSLGNLGLGPSLRLIPSTLPASEPSLLPPVRLLALPQNCAPPPLPYRLLRSRSAACAARAALVRSVDPVRACCTVRSDSSSKSSSLGDGTASRKRSARPVRATGRAFCTLAMALSPLLYEALAAACRSSWL
mmetsp:Transcript_30573/g.76947  ORF Transcript_30573/g.76947 Transcript_30573/m.76947 type:complete len:249 (+) Transcript_30573:349-1095(+)